MAKSSLPFGTYTAAHPSRRCTAVITLKDKSTYDCMRPETEPGSGLCWQHAKSPQRSWQPSVQQGGKRKEGP